ncbi:MAG: M14 family metallopeptidase [Gilvibacter sp.]
MKLITAFFVAFLLLNCSSQPEGPLNISTVFEDSNGTQTATYEQVVSFYEALSEHHQSVSMYTLEDTDSGKPLHLITYNKNRSFENEFTNDRKEIVVLINNGIHPGESDGIDASMMLMRDLANGTIESPENTIVAVIPVYNIGGALNRNSHSRTNQNGPSAYGFRGNARNFDLNRDFVKADTRNAVAFQDVFNLLKPDVFIDTHVSNGADYQYTLTHLFTQHNRLGGELGNFLHTQMMPQLEDSLQIKDWDITPYVNVFNRSPESGFSQFMDGPRYSTGYTTMFNTLGMMIETHMLKPYKDRVEGTYAILQNMIGISDANANQIKEMRKKANERFAIGNYYPIAWAIDSTQTTILNFKGYEALMKPSEVTNANRLYYDREAPFERPVTYYNYFKAIDSVKIPETYIIPRGWWPIVQKLRNNKIKANYVAADTLMQVEGYRIANYNTRQRPYEGHYVHYNTQLEPFNKKVWLRGGYYTVQTQQHGLRFILETLEPLASDSYFNWNFFDTVLQQKEGFSPYVWEDLAFEFLEQNPEVKAQFEAKISSEPAFAANWYAQLDWIHKQSPHYEKAHLRYPIFRVGG